MSADPVRVRVALDSPAGEALLPRLSAAVRAALGREADHGPADSGLADNAEVLLRLGCGADPVASAGAGGPAAELRFSGAAFTDAQLLDAVERVLWTLPRPAGRALAALTRALLRPGALCLLDVRDLRLIDSHLREIFTSIRGRFDHFGRLVVVAQEAAQERIRRLPGGLADGLEYAQSLSAFAPEGVNAVVQLSASNAVEHDETLYEPRELRRFVEAGVPAYTLQVNYVEMRLRRLVDEDNWLHRRYDLRSHPHADENHLARTHVETGACCFRTCFGMHHFTGNEAGPVCATGYRIAGDFRRLADRGPKEAVVACFGGSEGLGWRCFFDRMYTARLEGLLNARAKAAGSGRRFHVLNFAQNGNTVLEEMRSFLLFCQGLRPDVVVSLGGFNDMFFGTLTDPELVAGYDLPHNHQFDYQPRAYGDGELDDARTESLAAAYVRRVEQFHALAGTCAGLFVHALQPAWIGKRPTPAETQGIRQWFDLYTLDPKNRPYQQAALNIGLLYPMLDERLDALAARLGPEPTPGRAGFARVNAHAVCLAHQDETLFLDVVHTTGLGHWLIARACYGPIARHFGLEEDA